MGLLPGVGGGFVKSAAGRALGGIGSFDYPKMTADFVVSEPLDFGGTKTSVDGVETVLPAMNGTKMDRSTLNAVLAQTLQEHNRAVADGTEKNLMEWWPGQDVKPRAAIHPASTAVRGIKIRDDGAIQVQWRGGDGKWYTYKGGKDIRESTEKVKDLLTMPSIGRALVRDCKRVWADSKHLKDKTGTPANRGVDGQWGRANYEEDRSKWGN